uniref:Uncharacterized protein n=1 Tax=Knipowitschia caucasica TaxID=637954 RepID=A0AAV2JTH1_KNICA
MGREGEFVLPCWRGAKVEGVRTPHTSPLCAQSAAVLKQAKGGSCEGSCRRLQRTEAETQCEEMSSYGAEKPGFGHLYRQSQDEPRRALSKSC